MAGSSRPPAPPGRPGVARGRDPQRLAHAVAFVRAQGQAGGGGRRKTALERLRQDLDGRHHGRRDVWLVGLAPVLGLSASEARVLVMPAAARGCWSLERCGGAVCENGPPRAARLGFHIGQSSPVNDASTQDDASSGHFPFGVLPLTHMNCGESSCLALRTMQAASCAGGAVA